MNITSLAINVIGLIFYSWLIWLCYQLYLAAWGRENAKQAWLKIFTNPLGSTLRPFFKWFILLLFSTGSFVLILLAINALMYLTLIFMMDSKSTL